MDIQTVIKRLKNKTVLSAFILSILTLIWKFSSLIGLSIPLEQHEVYDLFLILINILCIVGLVVDQQEKVDSTSDDETND